MVVRVVLPLPVDQAYTYRVPGEMGSEARVGCRVLVPFGTRRLTGLIVEVAPSEEAGEGYDLKDVLDVLDEEPACTEEMLRLTRWVADYYVCSWGEALRAALPSGLEVEEQRRVVPTGAAPPPGLREPVRALLACLAAEGEATVAELQGQGLEVSLALLRRLERDGLVRLESHLSRPKVRVKYEKRVGLAPTFRSVGAVRDLKAQVRGEKQAAVLDALTAFLGEGEPAPRQADVLGRAGASAASLRSLVERGLVEVVEHEVLRSALGDLPAPAPGRRHALHRAQEGALARITDAAAAGRFETFLLHGVTGSGKTEVYIAALQEVLARGKTGIILVPEIALTPQTVQRFRVPFGDRIAVLHSRMSLGERYDAWRTLRSGRFSIVIGPRSAIFAPLCNVGLIVVDEEHEPSYKQFNPAPRYHARDVAVVRARMNDAVCILGSATPSLESYRNARIGKYTLAEMPERVPVPGHAAAPLPEIHVVDLALERKKHRLEGALSHTLREAIEERLERGEQVILLQNRRGYAPVVECQACGWVPLCRDCSVTLTYHKPARARRDGSGGPAGLSSPHLRCHYCGHVERIPPACPVCGEVDFAPLGAGTQRVEEELHGLFPEAIVLRMDLDTTGRKGSHHQILDRFGRGEADILIGTQMVAKGLDFSRVTLVGVINADVGMMLPDFRSEERTFQLLTQVAGRAGRAELRGEVIFQTRNPKHPVFRYLLAHEYAGFSASMLTERRALGYPPFGHVVGIEFRGPNEEKVGEVARQWTALLTRRVNGCVQVLGPEPAFIGRVKRQYRYHTILKMPRGPSTLRLQDVLRDVATQFGPPPRGYHLAIDVDAIGLF